MKFHHATIYTVNAYLLAFIFYCFSNQVFAELLSILVPLTTMEDWLTSQGRTSFHSLSEPQRMALIP